MPWRRARLMMEGALLLAPGLAPAQSPWELHPRMGVYFSPGLLNAAYGPTGAATVRRRQLTAITFGVGATLWTARFLSVEGAVTFAPSMVATTDTLTTMDATSGVILGSLRANVGIRRRTEGWSLYGGPGFGVIHRGAAARGSARDVTAPALILALGGRLALPHSPAFTFEVASYSSWIDTRFEASAAPQRRWHQDLVWSFGLAIPVENQ
jgi:hypothetical protein